LLLKEIIWVDTFVDKIQNKHNVTVEEVEDALVSGAIFRIAKRGKVKGEDIYVAYGKTNVGRHLLIVFIYKQNMIGLIISARDMTNNERKYYNGKKI